MLPVARLLSVPNSKIVNFVLHVNLEPDARTTPERGRNLETNYVASFGFGKAATAAEKSEGNGSFCYLKTSHSLNWNL